MQKLAGHEESRWTPDERLVDNQPRLLHNASRGLDGAEACFVQVVVRSFIPVTLSLYPWSFPKDRTIGHGAVGLFVSGQLCF